jgi:hypothetical protein
MHSNSCACKKKLDKYAVPSTKNVTQYLLNMQILRSDLQLLILMTRSWNFFCRLWDCYRLISTYESLCLAIICLQLFIINGNSMQVMRINQIYAGAVWNFLFIVNWIGLCFNYLENLVRWKPDFSVLVLIIHRYHLLDTA